MKTEITQADLNGFVGTFDFHDAVGAEGQAERDAAREGVNAQTYRVVDAAQIADARTDEGSGDARFYLTVDEARTILPRPYKPFTRDGREYPAPKSIPTVQVRGFLGCEIERAKAQLAEHRAKVASQRKQRAADRNAMLDAWLAGDEDVRVLFERKAQDGRAVVWDLSPA